MIRPNRWYLFLFFLSIILFDHSSTLAGLPPEPDDSSSICKQKKAEFDSLRTILFAKLNVVEKERDLLEEKHPGTWFYIDCNLLKVYHWQGCFPRQVYTECNDCGWRFELEQGEIVDADFTIRRVEAGCYSSNRSCMYFDEIQRMPY